MRWAGSDVQTYMEAKQEDAVKNMCVQQTSHGWIALRKNNADRLCHSERKLLVKELQKGAEWQDMLNVSQIAQCSTSHCKWHQKDEEGLENTAGWMLGLTEAVF